MCAAWVGPVVGWVCYHFCVFKIVPHENLCTVTRIQVAGARTLLADASFLFAGVRIQVTEAKTLLTDATILFTEAKTLVAEARIFLTGARILFTGTPFLKQGGTILNCPACFLDWVGCFLVTVAPCKLQPAYLFVLAACCAKD